MVTSGRCGKLPVHWPSSTVQPGFGFAQVGIGKEPAENISPSWDRARHKNHAMMARAHFLVGITLENWNQFWRDFWRAAEQGPRLFFAPLLGAISQTRIEWRRAERELRRNSDAGAAAPKPGKH
jgi:hypothetical protein